MKKILVPTDFSDNAANAIEYAAQLALVHQYKVVLLHVMTASSDASEAEDKLRIITVALQMSFPDLVVTYRLVGGEDVPDEIVSAASLYEAHLIVMGTRGLSDLGKVIFGSNAAMVIEKAACTVLSIPSKSVYTRPKRILYATNYEHQDINAAVEMVQTIKPFGGTLIIGHVLTDRDAEESEKITIESFIREVSLISDYSRITYRLACENTVALGLDLLLTETRADMIALRTHRRNLFEKIINPSITKKFAEKSQVPLMAFHATSAG